MEVGRAVAVTTEPSFGFGFGFGFGFAGATRWPDWAAAQVHDAAAVASSAASRPGHPALAAELYRHWFNPVLGPPGRASGSLAGAYRAAHAGSGSRTSVDGVWVVDRNDVVGRDGWWRTWNDAWLPTRSRAGSVRLLFSPVCDAVTDLVAIVTARLGDSAEPWLLACATDPRRLTRAATAVLAVPTVRLGAAAGPDTRTRQPATAGRAPTVSSVGRRRRARRAPAQRDEFR